MRRWLLIPAMLLVTSATCAQTSPPSVAPVRLQYVQVREFLDPDTPPPPPETFDQALARAKAAPMPPAPTADAAQDMLAGLVAEQVQQRFLGLAAGKLSGLLMAANPLVGMLAQGLVGKGEQALQARSQQAMAAHYAQQGHANMMAALRRLPAYERVSIWDREVRIDNPREHTSVIYQPARGRYVVIDHAHKLYRVISGPPPEPAQTDCDDAPLSVAPLPQRSFGALQVGGARRVFGPLDGDDDSGFTLTQELYWWDKPIPADVLEMATGEAGCPAGSPAAQGDAPADRLVVYSGNTSHIDAQDGSAGDGDGIDPAFLATAGFNSVLMRGRFRNLGDADRELFEIPAGYRPVN